MLLGRRYTRVSILLTCEDEEFLNKQFQKFVIINIEERDKNYEKNYKCVINSFIDDKYGSM